MNVKEAQVALERAEQKLRDAGWGVDNARAALDGVFATHGWRRMAGAFAAGSEPLYENVLYPGAALNADQLIAIIEQQAKAAAA